MTGLDLYSAQDSITTYIKSKIPWVVQTGSIPTAESLPFVNGVLEPYVVLRFSDMLSVAKDYTFAGPQYDGYYSLFDALCIAALDTQARQLATLVNQAVLGMQLPNVSAITKQYGGGSFAVLDTARLPAAFVSNVAFRFQTNISDVGAGTLVT